MASDCIFCKVAEKKIPAKIVHEDPELVVFRDINPQAPVHVLVVPRRHVALLNDLEPQDAALMGRLILAATEVAKKEGIDGRGYRIVLNCNREAGQSVWHIHLHLLGGRAMSWPPG